MATFTRNAKSGDCLAKVLPVEWSAPEAFLPQVKEGPNTVNQQNPERIHYVKLVIGIFDNCTVSGSPRICRNSRHGGVDR